MSEFKPAGRTLHPIASLMKRGRMSMWIALAIFILGLPVIFVKGTSNFSTEAIFEVFPTFQTTHKGDEALQLQSNSQYREFVNNLSVSLRRYSLIESAVEKLEQSNVKVCFGGETRRRCVERLQKVLVVLPVPDTYMVRVLLNSDDKKDLDVILNAVMDQFVTMVRDEQVYGADDRIKALIDQRNIVEVEIADLEQKRAALANDLGITSFNQADKNPYDTVLTKLRERLVEVSIDRSYAENSLKAFELNKEASTRETKSIADLTATNAGLNVMTTAALVRIEALNQAMSDLQPAHPIYKSAKDERDTIQKRLNDREAKTEATARATILARLTAAYQQTSQVERELQKNLKEASEKATDYAKLIREAKVLTDALDKRTVELNDIRERMTNISQQSGSIGWIKLIQRAMPAQVQAGIGRTRMLLILSLICILVAIAVPIMLDMLDRRILTVGDAEKAMGMQAAGWLVDPRNTSARMLADDQCRRLASTLLRNKSRSENGIFAFAPVSFGGESTEAILEVAKTLQILGSRVLVVDANHMRLDSLINIAGPNLHDILSGKTAPQDGVGILDFNGESLSVVAMGAQSTGLRRLDRLKDAFEVWSTEFDVILVDIPPLMHSADSEFLIDMIGQVFLIVEVGGVTRSDVLQARQQVSKIDPAAVGLIVTRLPMREAGKSTHKQMAESITRTPFGELMSISDLQLKYQIALLKSHRFYLKLGKKYPKVYRSIQELKQKIHHVAQELTSHGLHAWDWIYRKTNRNNNIDRKE
jgi:polysaccharide biosynthesis transport protein